MLRRLPALADAPEGRLDDLVSLVDERSVRAGTVLVHQGDAAVEAYLVLTGEVDVETSGQPVARLRAGAIVGEVALLADAPRMSTVTAATDLDLLVLGEDAFAALLDQPEVARQLATELAQRLHDAPSAASAVPATNDAWERLTPAEQQVARLVADGLTNSEIAEQLFLSRHTVESHLKHIFTKLNIRSRVALATDVVPR
jgi:CRP-like cAMP-binding protein